MFCRLVVALLLVGLCPPNAAGDDKDKPNFPDDSQINLLLTQAERAFDTYENAVKLEQIELGDEEGKRDREVLDAARQLLPKLKANPQMFNSPYGFLLVIDLDDASRNMAVCMGQGGMSASSALTDGNTSAAQSKLHLAQTCMDASALLYTVSETATSLYENYLLSNALLQQEVVDVSKMCADTLKKLTPPPTKK